jgi:hypothetical protein
LVAGLDLNNSTNRDPEIRKTGSISRQSQPYLEPVRRLGKSRTSATSLDISATLSVSLR